MNERDQRAYRDLRSSLEADGADVEGIEERLRSQQVETPSWGYGNSGTRFRVFPQKGVPRTPFEKVEDAAEVHRHTGICPSVAIHIPWDRIDNMLEVRQHAESLGMRIGAVNPNLFQEDEYRLGSVCNADSAIRRMATDHMIECVEIAKGVDSQLLSVWLADGTNYPGQDSFVDRRSRMLGCLTEVYAAMPATMRMLVEYKFFEPGFYHTDLSDWGTALLTCQKLGDRAQVLVDLGHHAQGTNVEHIVAILLEEGRLGGFHFNNRKYADDDLLVGAINPFELFLIYVELTRPSSGERSSASPVAYMLDQSHNIEPKIEAMIVSVMNLQEMYAKALLVDRQRLVRAQQDGDVLGAHSVITAAYATDVRPMCAKVREDLGASAHPVSAFRDSGYLERVAATRVGGTQAGWN